MVELVTFVRVQGFGVIKNFRPARWQGLDRPDRFVGQRHLARTSIFRFAVKRRSLPGKIQLGMP